VIHLLPWRIVQKGVIVMMIGGGGGGSSRLPVVDGGPFHRTNWFRHNYCSVISLRNMIATMIVTLTTPPPRQPQGHTTVTHYCTVIPISADYTDKICGVHRMMTDEEMYDTSRVVDVVYWILPFSNRIIVDAVMPCSMLFWICIILQILRIFVIINIIILIVIIWIISLMVSIYCNNNSSKSNHHRCVCCHPPIEN
jgi:hypothetical protein